MVNEKSIHSRQANGKLKKRSEASSTGLGAIHQKKNVKKDIDDDHINEYITEDQWKNRRAVVYNAVDLRYHLVYLNNDICQLVKNKKLNNVKLQTLRNI